MKVNIFLFLLLSLSRQLHYNNEEFGGLVLKLYNFNYLHSKDFFKPKRIKYKEEISYKVLKLVPVLEQVLIVQAPWKLILPAPKGPVFFFKSSKNQKYSGLRHTSGNSCLQMKALVFWCLPVHWVHTCPSWSKKSESMEFTLRKRSDSEGQMQVSGLGWSEMLSQHHLLYWLDCTAIKEFCPPKSYEVSWSGAGSSY